MTAHNNDPTAILGSIPRQQTAGLGEPTDPLPIEWLQELHGLDPRSHQYREMLGVLGELAAISGAGLELPPSSESLATPGGFKEINLLGDYRTHISTESLASKAKSLVVAEKFIEVPAQELVSDTGKRIRVCDLRGFMSESVQKLAPGMELERKRLDAAFWMDMKHFADSGRIRNTVTGVSGIGYTKVPKTKIRGYWTLVHDQNNVTGIPTIARLADCKDSVSAESSLYRSVFAMKL